MWCLIFKFKNQKIFSNSRIQKYFQILLTQSKMDNIPLILENTSSKKSSSRRCLENSEVVEDKDNQIDVNLDSRKILIEVTISS